MSLWNQVLKAMNCLSQANNSYLPFHFFKFKTCCFTLLRRKPCHCWYFTIVFALFSVAVAVSTHLCVIFVSISAVLSRCFKAMSLVEIYPNVFPYRASTAWLQLHVVAGMREARVAGHVGRGLRPSQFSPKLNTVLQGGESF